MEELVVLLLRFFTHPDPTLNRTIVLHLSSAEHIPLTKDTTDTPWNIMSLAVDAMAAR